MPADALLDSLAPRGGYHALGCISCPNENAT